MGDRRPLLLSLALLFALGCAGRESRTKHHYLCGLEKQIVFHYRFRSRIRAKPGGLLRTHGRGRIVFRILARESGTLHIRPLHRHHFTAGYARSFFKRLNRLPLPDLVFSDAGELLLVSSGTNRLIEPDPATRFLCSILILPLAKTPEFPESLSLPGVPPLQLTGSVSETVTGTSRTAIRKMSLQPLFHAGFRIHEANFVLRQPIPSTPTERVSTQLQFSVRFTKDALIPINGVLDGSLTIRRAEGTRDG